MAHDGLSTRLGPLSLRSPLIAASGTVGSVWEWASVADVTPYGAAVAKSVSREPWVGRPPPRLAPTTVGMLNGIGIQNPGVEVWSREVAPRLSAVDVPVWGSAVGEEAGEFAAVAKSLEAAGVPAVEVNLSCPNLAAGTIFSFDPEASGAVVESVRGVLSVPVGAKLSPNTPDVVRVAERCLEAGADFLTLTNTALGFGLSIESGRPSLSGGVGGYSGPGIKPIALRCVYEVARAFPGTPIVGTGGVTSGRDVVEYLMAGATAVGIGSLHLAEPRAGKRLLRELRAIMNRMGVHEVGSLVGTVTPW